MSNLPLLQHPMYMLSLKSAINYSFNHDDNHTAAPGSSVGYEGKSWYPYCTIPSNHFAVGEPQKYAHELTSTSGFSECIMIPVGREALTNHYMCLSENSGNIQFNDTKFSTIYYVYWVSR